MDDIAWAAADLEHAKTLYEQAVASGKPADQTWRRQGYEWHIRAWQDQLATPTMGDPDSITPGLWNVSLFARGSGELWQFSWNGEGWYASAHDIGFSA